MWLWIVEVVVALLIVVGLVSQVILPWVWDVPIFPSFRASRRQLERELAQAQGEDEIRRLRERIEAMRRREARSGWLRRTPGDDERKEDQS